jgi:hypothetical protein
VCLGVLVAVFACMSVAACGGGGLPASTVQPTAGLPTRSSAEPAPSPTTRPSGSSPQRSPATLPTRSADLVLPQSSPPAPSPAATQPEPAPEVTASAPPPTSASAPPSSSTSPWLWWLIGLLAVLAVVVTVLVRRSQRAVRARDAQLATAVSESRWLAHELLPDTLSAPGATERRAIWTAYRPRVDVLMNSLDDASASASQDRRDGAGRLRDAVQDLVFTTDTYARIGLDDPADLSAVRHSQRRLEEALRAVHQGTATRRSG